VLNSWLGLKDIAKLDSACGASRNSAELHNAICGGLTLVQNTVISKGEVGEWLVKRNVALKSVDLKSLALATKPFVAVCCKHLAHLKLHCQTLPKAADFVYLVNLQSICGQLESVEFTGVLSQEAVAMLICSMPSLRCIDMTKCAVHDEAQLVQLCASNCPQLEEIRFAFCSIASPAMVELATKCTGLKVVRALYYSRSHHRDPQKQAADLSPEFIAHCPNLTKLYVGVISEAAIRKIAECCPLLTVLHCSCDRETPNDALEALARGCPLIRKLVLLMFEALDARVIYPLANLEELTVLSSTTMDNGGVKNIVRCCPNLKVVKMVDCLSVTEESVYVMLTGLPKLRVLKLDNDDNSFRSPQQTCWRRLAQKFLMLHYPHVKCTLKFDDPSY
jgi:hypothetical protein